METLCLDVILRKPLKLCQNNANIIVCKVARFIQVHAIWAASSELVSSSIPSWQIVTAHAQPFSWARDLAFCLKVPLDSLLVWANSGGSGETARMRRLAWTFAARIGDKNQIRLTRPIYLHTFFTLVSSKTWETTTPVTTSVIYTGTIILARPGITLINYFCKKEMYTYKPTRPFRNSTTNEWLKMVVLFLP